jgi:hypothetical protein
VLQQETDNIELNKIFPIPLSARTNLTIKEATIKTLENDPF